MGPPSESQQEPRCPACGALVTADAAWCGQCLTPLARPTPHAAPAPAAAPEPAGEPAVAAAAQAAPGRTATTTASTEPSWPCPVCGNDNAIELDACAVCGTTFAALMREADAPPSISPEEALRWSLIFPGLGHRKVGRPLDGLTRGILFALLAGMALLIALGGLKSSVLVGLFALYLVCAVAVYVGSALEARQLAQGGALFLPTRQVLWAGVILLMSSMALLTLSVISETKR